MIIDEEFNTILAMNWNIWGEPRPIIEQGFGDNFLSLTATNPGDAGVTSKEDFVLQPGVEIDFGAQLQPGYSQYVLVFSWDPNQFVRQPGNNEPGVLQMEVSADKVTIKSALTIEMCVASIRGADAHDFSFRILDDNRVALYIDNLDEPVCTLVDIGMDAPIVGRITFRSMGLVSYVYVASP